jgi:ribonuclease Z
MRRLLWLTLILCASLPAFGATTMEVVLLGTGNPRPDPDRAGPSTAIIVTPAAGGKKVFLIDTGRGVIMRYAALSLPTSDIRAVFLTHLHSDHISGLPDLFTTTWIFGRKEPLELYGPEGVKAMSAALLKFYAVDIPIRRDLVEYDPAEGAKINAHTVQEGVVYQDADVKVTAFLVDHGPVKPAFGYMFEGGGRRIVISGDTTANDNLVKHAKGADVLVHEVYAPGTFEAHNPPKVAANLNAYHSSAEQVGEVAERAGVKLLVLTHIVGADPESLKAIEKLVGARFHGKFVLGKDLMKF